MKMADAEVHDPSRQLGAIVARDVECSWQLRQERLVEPRGA
jgi:hypothetical protein